jgi:uncharacterized protein
VRPSILTIIIALTLPVSVFAYTSPGKPVGLVNDFAKIISTQESAALGQKLLALNKATGAEVAVVTIASLGGDTIENYAVKLFEEWQIGQKGKDNGILILVAPNDHQARIEVGYGLEGTITDLQAGNIVNQGMIPAFKNSDYDGGIDTAVTAVSGLIEGDPSVITTYSKQIQGAADNGGSSSHISFAALFFFAVIILNILARILGRTKSWWLGGVLGAIAGIIIGLIWGFVFIGFGAIIILTILGLIFDYIVSKHPPGSGRGPGGFWPIFFGGGNGGFGGGGFGGFGGGSSGGGGASGKW